MAKVSSREGRKWAAYGRGALVTLCVPAAALNVVSINGERLLPVIAAALVCGVALLVPRLRWPLAPLLVTVATAWWGWPLLPMLSVALFDLAVDRRARVAVGCAVAALSANLLSYRATSLWTAQSYASTLLLPVLAVLVGLWLGAGAAWSRHWQPTSSTCASSHSCARKRPASRNGPASPPRCTTSWPTA